MVDTITIKNFRSFNDVKIEGLRRINLLVGENGSGKTALLEALFLAGGVSPELAMRTRSWRGAENPELLGTKEGLHVALWSDLFHRFQTNRSAVISLRGTGDENRSVTITLNPRGYRQAIAPSRSAPNAKAQVVVTQSPIEFKWKVQSYPDVVVRPTFHEGKLVFQDVSDRYVKASFFAANRLAPSWETAGRFSQLSKHFEEQKFLGQFRKLYSRITDISIELSAGAPMLFAHVADLPEKIPLTLASGGMSKLAAILLAMTEQRSGLVIVDEIENGFYHSKLADVWRALHEFSIENDCQLFLSTHSAECLVAAATLAEKSPQDFAVMRTVLEKGETKVRHFDGNKFAEAIKEDIDIR